MSGTEEGRQEGPVEQTVTFQYTKAEYLEGMVAAYNRCLVLPFPVAMGLLGAVVEGVIEYGRGQAGVTLLMLILMHATVWSVIGWLALRGFSRLAWWFYRRKPEAKRTLELRRDGSRLWIDGLGRVCHASEQDVFATLSCVSLVRLPWRAVHFVPTHALRAVRNSPDAGKEAPLVASDGV